jgi:arabinogalactan oligomer/maltooligosaccharide transport system permease protein
MIGWSGRRKALVVLGFILPTLVGLLLFNIYPTLLNTYISFTNRNKFHPNPDCAQFINSLMVPNCWPIFKAGEPSGLGKPYGLIDPLSSNYAAIMGDLFNASGLLSILTLVLCIVPLIVVYQVDKRMEAQLTRPIASSWLWVIGILTALGLLVFLGATAWTNLTTAGDFMAVVMRTILFVILRVPFTFVLGLIMALILSSPGLPFRTFWRVVLFIPWAASSVAILTSLVWQFFFREQGTINQVLSLLFGVKGPVWLNDPLLAFAIVLLVDIWYSYPFFMITIIGAMTAISTEIYEAAEIDGASYFTQLRSLTLPLIRPAILPALVLTSITAFQMFGTVYAITEGGPISAVGKPGATEFVMVYAYKQIFQLQNYGTATAFATIIFIFLFSATLYSLRLTRLTKGATA